MRKFAIAILVIIGAGAAHAGTISATSGDGPGQDLQSLFDGWVGPGYDVNAEFQTPGYWTIGATGLSAATLIIEIAGNAGSNTIGLFDRNDVNNRLEVYSGAAGGGDKRVIDYNQATGLYRVIDMAILSVLDSATFSGSSFGFYLAGPGGTFFSPPSLNNDDVQMVAFQGDGRPANFLGTGNAPWLSNEWVLAWEDLVYGPSDQDFNDLVLIIESVTPVPEPGSIVLLGAGILGLVVLRRKRV